MLPGSSSNEQDTQPEQHSCQRQPVQHDDCVPDLNEDPLQSTEVPMCCNLQHLRERLVCVALH